MWHILKRKLWMQRSELKMMLVMSAISLMMMFAFGGFGGFYKPEVLVTDLDHTTLSEKYMAALTADKTHDYTLVTPSEGQQMVKENKAMALVTLEKGFEAQLLANQAPALNLTSVKNDAEIMVLKPLLLSQYRQLSNWHKTSDQIASDVQAKGADYQKTYDETYSKLKKGAMERQALTLTQGIDNSLAQKNAIMMHSLIGFLIFFVAYSCVFGATDILTERKQNTWQRLLISPSSKLGMLVGNFLVSWILGIIQLSLIFVVGVNLFHVDFGGNLSQMFMAGLLFCFAMSGFGILLSSLAKSMQQIGALTSVALTAFGMLGGCLWPLDLVTNPILIGLSKIVPHTYAVKAMTNLSQGGSFQSVLPQLAVLAGMAAVFLAIGFVKLMAMEEQYQ